MRPLRFLLAAYLALGLLYALATPPFEASDEVFHYPYVRNIALGRGLPVQEIGVKQPWAQVGSHPPAYYLLSAALTFWIDTSDFEAVHVLNPFARIGIPGTPQNANQTRYPAQALTDPFPPRRTILAVWIIRCLSLLMGAGTVAFTYFLALTLNSPSPVGGSSRRERGAGSEGAFLTAALVAFNPMFLFISASVNNDNMVWLESALALFVVVHLTRGPSQFIRREYGEERWEAIGLGVLLGLAALTKLSGLVLLPITGLALIIQALRTQNWRRFWRSSFIIAVLILLLAGWWYIRNLTLYGELLGLNRMVAIAGPRQPTITVPKLFATEWRSFWYSYWGLFGAFSVPGPQWMYGFYSALAVIALIGLVRSLFTRSLFTDRWSLLTHSLLTLFTFLTFVSLIRWTLMTLASQGRLMFTALAPLSLYLALGLLAWVPIRQQRRVLGGFIGVLGFIAVFIAVNNVAAAYIPPAPLSEAHLPADLRPVQARLAPGVELIGYTLDSPDYHAPGETLTVTFYWRAFAPMTMDYNLFLHILGRNRELVGNVDTWPGGGLRPTSFWRRGDIYGDRYVIQLDPNSTTPSLLWLDAAMWETDPGTPLPITHPDSAPIPSVIVPVGKIDSPEAVTAAPETRMDSTLEGGVSLIGFDFPESLAHGQPTPLKLYWQSFASVPVDYTVFVHTVDSTGQLVAQADGPPLNGDWPTSAWRPARWVSDSRPIMISNSGEYAIRVGLYDPVTGVRLAAFRADGSEWPDAAIELTTVTVK